MKKQNTLISILIINYNNHNLLKRSIESCLSQSYKNIEILIFDDQSNDDSPNVLKKFNKNKKIKNYFNKKKKPILLLLMPLTDIVFCLKNLRERLFVY